MRVAVVRQKGKKAAEEGRGGKEGQRWVSEKHLQFKTRFGIMKM